MAIISDKEAAARQAAALQMAAHAQADTGGAMKNLMPDHLVRALGLGITHSTVSVSEPEFTLEDFQDLQGRVATLEEQNRIILKMLKEVIESGVTEKSDWERLDELC